MSLEVDENKMKRRIKAKRNAWNSVRHDHECINGCFYWKRWNTANERVCMQLLISSASFVSLFIFSPSSLPFLLIFNGSVLVLFFCPLAICFAFLIKVITHERTTITLVFIHYFLSPINFRTCKNYEFNKGAMQCLQNFSRMRTLYYETNDFHRN